MAISNYALDRFVSQQLSQLTECRPQSLSEQFPSRATWLDEFVRRRILQNHVREDRAALAFVLVRRAVAALAEWEATCQAATQDLRRPSAYFELLRHCENCIAVLWQGLELGRKALGMELYAKGDGSEYERLNWLHNKGRHFDPQELPEDALHAVWLANGGVHTLEHAISWDELRSMVSMLGRVAEQIVKGPEPTERSRR